MISNYFSNVKQRRVHALFRNGKETEHGDLQTSPRGWPEEPHTAQRSASLTTLEASDAADRAETTSRALSAASGVSERNCSEAVGSSVFAFDGSTTGVRNDDTIAAPSSCNEDQEHWSAPVTGCRTKVTEKDWVPLLEIMDGIESARLLLRARQARPTFEQVQAVVQWKCRRELTRQRLDQLLGLVPEVFMIHRFGPGETDLCIELREQFSSMRTESSADSVQVTRFGDAYGIMKRRALLRERLEAMERPAPACSDEAMRRSASQPLEVPSCGKPILEGDSSATAYSPQQHAHRKRRFADGCNSQDVSHDTVPPTPPQPFAKRKRTNDDFSPADELVGEHTPWKRAPQAPVASAPRPGASFRREMDVDGCASMQSPELVGYASPVTESSASGKSHPASFSQVSTVDSRDQRMQRDNAVLRSTNDALSATPEIDGCLPAELIQRIRDRAAERDCIESSRRHEETCLNIRRLIHAADLVYSFFQTPCVLGRPRRSVELDQLTAFLCQQHDSAPQSYEDARQQLQQLCEHSAGWCWLEKGSASGKTLFRINADRNAFREMRLALTSLLSELRKQIQLNDTAGRNEGPSRSAAAVNAHEPHRLEHLQQPF